MHRKSDFAWRHGGPNATRTLRAAYEEFEYAYEVSVPLADKKDLGFEPPIPSEAEFGEWKEDIRIPRDRLADIHGFITCTLIPRLAGFFSDTPDTPLSRADLVGPV